jgi:type I restriction enzyme S subunit
LLNGRAYKKDELLQDGKYPVLRVGNFFSNREWYYSDLELPEKNYCERGDLLYAWSASFGPRIWDGCKVIYHYHIWKVEIDESKVDKNYLCHVLEKDVEDIKREQGTGSTMIHVTKTAMENREIPLPPLAEQKRIAAILDKADALRRKRQQAIDLADQFLRSVFLEMFGDPVTNSKGWPTMPLKDLSRVVTGNTPSRKAPENYGSGIEWIKSDNINTPQHYLTEAEERLSDIGLAKGRSVPSGSVLVTCIAGSPQCIGNAAIADREVAFNQQINALIPGKNATTEYLYSLALFGKKLIQGASSNSMKGMVSKGNLERLVVPAPPKDLQDEYSNIFRELLRKKQRQASSLDHFSSLFSSFNQQAFRGEL